MKVLVIGATGRTGGHAVDRLLAQGHTVTALARNPADFGKQHDNLRVAQGNARNAESLERAIEGQDAVLSAFGTGMIRPGDLQEVYMKNLVAGMKAKGVRRLVNLSGWGASESYAHATLSFKIVRALVLRWVYEDKERGEVHLVASGLDWVNVRPGRLTNAKARGGVKASLDGVGLAAHMSREDLANFMVDQLASDTWVGKAPIIGY